MRIRWGRARPVVLLAVLLVVAVVGVGGWRLLASRLGGSGEWKPVGQTVEAGDAVVWVAGAELGPVHLLSPLNMLDVGPHLLVRVGVRPKDGVGSLKFWSWGSRNIATAVDEHGNPYTLLFPAPNMIKGRPKEFIVSAGQAIEDLIVFQAPAANAKTIRVELENMRRFGDEPIRFEIPTSMLKPTTRPYGEAAATQLLATPSTQPAAVPATEPAAAPATQPTSTPTTRPAGEPTAVR